VLIAPLRLVGSMDADIFEAYVEHRAHGTGC